MATLNLQVSADLDNVSWKPGGGRFETGALRAGYWSAVGAQLHVAAIFHSVSGLSSATINSAIYKIYANANGVGSPETVLKMNDTETPVIPTNETEADALVRTTSTAITWDEALTNNTEHSSPDIKTHLQEMIDSGFDPASVMVIHEADIATGANYMKYDPHSVSSVNAPKFDIDYTPAAGGTPDMSFVPQVHGIHRLIVPLSYLMVAKC